ncbi:Mrp/NBP35 family ATP-binding protein [bacterium]|nr:Mrp/NBP35 family ATP-binding protein [bacterium]
MSEKENACDSCSSESCAAKSRKPNEADQDYQERQELAQRMCRVKHKLFVLSGKGGVGKSSVAAGLAVALAGRGQRVGLLDIDLHGPSIPRLMGLPEARAAASDGGIIPVQSREGVSVMSIGFMLEGQDDAVIWRGPLKYSVIKQFLKDVEWGDLDYLIIDSPPGTGDEPLTVAQLIEDADGALIVTTPQAVAVTDVRKSIDFARRVGLPVLGVIENMSGFVCPGCGKRSDVFGAGGGEEMALDMGVPFLGRIPIDPALVASGDAGGLGEFITGTTAGAESFRAVVEGIIKIVEKDEG